MPFATYRAQLGVPVYRLYKWSIIATVLPTYPKSAFPVSNDQTSLNVVENVRSIQLTV